MGKGWISGVADLKSAEHLRPMPEPRGPIGSRWVYRPFVPASAEVWPVPARPRPPVTAELTEPVKSRTIVAN
jgi:hypothetical protein